MSEAMNEQDQDMQSTPAPPRRRVVTVRSRGVAPVGPDEISREQYEELGCDRERVIEFVRRRDAEQGAAAS